MALFTSRLLLIVLGAFAAARPDVRQVSDSDVGSAASSAASSAPLSSALSSIASSVEVTSTGATFASSAAPSSIPSSVEGSTIASSTGAVSSSATSAASASITSSATASNSSEFATSSSAEESSASSAPPTTVSHTIPLSSYSFSAFPAPTYAPVPGVFPETDPSSPPGPYDQDIIPDFSAAWLEAWDKAQQKIAGYTLEQKINISTGVGWENGRCVGNIGAINASDGSVDFPGLCLEDSPLGVRFADFVTAFPTAINAAATWNRGLIRLRGLFMGQEHVAKGVNVQLGPMMNIGRVAQGGRNWEGFGADPYLAGEAAYETILGMQEAGVQACAKHLINNEQEHKRTTESSDVDDRTEHEIYAHPFLRSIMAGVASIMCSYNAINGTYACENDKILNDVVKREYGFQGYIMSDWGATMSAISPIAGLDMTMPGDAQLGGIGWYETLLEYVHNGTIPESRIDDMATRILAGWYLLKQDDPSFPTANFDAFLPENQATNEHVDAQDEEHTSLVRNMGAASIVLLKNERDALPLHKPRALLLAGSDAGPGRAGPNQFADQGGSDGVLAMGWGSGTANFTYLITPLEAIQRRARKDRTSVSWLLDDFDLPLAGNMAKRVETMAPGRNAAIVFVNSDSGEQYITVDGNEGDRKNLTAWHGGDDLILAVAAQNNNTIVVVHSVGPLILEPWIDHENVTAVLWAGVPGNEAGNSLVDVLYGRWNPSGRLPYTIAKSLEDYGTGLILGGTNEDFLNIPYTEGLFVDYRRFDYFNITPRFEFGFGLSYTDFEYSNLVISAVDAPDGTDQDLADAWAQGVASPIAEGSSTALWLHRPAFTVEFDVTNSGDLFGGEIPQLYVNPPDGSGEPPSVLKGFTNVEALPGETKHVSLPLSRYDLSIWDVVQQGWAKPNGTIGVTVGASSRDGRLSAEVPL
ncbi:glycoside hydrolase family 3 protein [Schizophyllum commune]